MTAHKFPWTRSKKEKIHNKIKKKKGKRKKQAQLHLPAMHPMKKKNTHLLSLPVWYRSAQQPVKAGREKLKP